MKFLAMIWYAFFAERSPEMEARQKLRQAQLDLVENQANLEYYSASVPMLRARIERIQSELGEVRSLSMNPLTPAQKKELETSFKTACRPGETLQQGTTTGADSERERKTWAIPRSLRSAQ